MLTCFISLTMSKERNHLLFAFNSTFPDDFVTKLEQQQQRREKSKKKK